MRAAKPLATVKIARLDRRPNARACQEQNAPGGDGGNPARHPEHVNKNKQTKHDRHVIISNKDSNNNYYSKQQQHRSNPRASSTLSAGNPRWRRDDALQGAY